MLKRQYEIHADKKIDVTLIVIVLLSVYMAWQMGILFFSGNSLSLYGRTPIPVEEPLTTIIIVVGYVATIIVHFFFYRYTILLGKVFVGIALIATIILFLPIQGGILAVAFYVTAFCCVFLIGTTYSIETGLYTNKTVLRSNIVGTIIGGAFIAVIQNDFYHLSFLSFNIVSLIALMLILVGYCLLPKAIETPRMDFKTAKQQVKLPKLLLLGLYVSPFVSTMLLVFSSVVAETVTHGVFIYYLFGALYSAFYLFLYFKWKISPFKISAVAFSLSVLGFVFAALSIIYPPLAYVAIVLTGGNVLIGNMIGFFANTAFLYRPTRVAGIGLVLIGFIIAMLQVGLLELFRDNLAILFAIISVLSMVFIVFYLLIEPSLSYRFRELEKANSANMLGEPVCDKIGNLQPITNLAYADSTLEDNPSNRTDAVEKLEQSDTTVVDTNSAGVVNSPSVNPPQLANPLLVKLNERDTQIVSLILQGYTVPEIAKALYYSEESIKTYKKNIYAALNVHSKRELFLLFNK